MKKHYIYNLAMNELMRRIEKEEEHLKANPNSQIAQSRLQRLHEEEKELHDLILAEEAK